jgi:hypothetical protein
MKKSIQALRPQGVIWPRDIECFFDISPPTRWRWERSGKLPARDIRIGSRGGWLAQNLPDIASWLAENVR